jgi:hypothetical protein
MVGLMVVEIGGGDEEKMCDVGEDVMVGKVGKLKDWSFGRFGMLLARRVYRKLNCTREYLIN